MIGYLLLPFLLLILVIFQVTVLDLFSIGSIGIELSLILVIYAGFHLDFFRGGIIVLLLGFLLDCLTSAIFGLYMFLYILIFYLAKIVGGKVYAGKPLLIGIFTGFCTLLEGLMIVLLYRFVLGVDLFYSIPKVFIPQAVVMGLLSPLFFGFLEHFEVFINVEDRRPARRI